MRPFTVAILGCGNRGAESYGRLLKDDARFRIAALCDPFEARLNAYGELFGVSARFAREEDFFEERRADILVIATMDRDHVRQCIRALGLGYDILLEKPITGSREELEALVAAQKRYGGKVLVCHVLRYVPSYLKAAKIIQSGKIGRLVHIDALEEVAFWHQAHSFVRGNWRNSEETVPMLLAKCCHDLDLLQFYAGARCESVSSVGDLTFFKPECAPAGAEKRCVICPLAETCAYSAMKIYIDGWKEAGRPARDFPYMQLTGEYPLTEEILTRAVKTGDYGRCVFFCDNDVVDHQIAQFTFANGVKATLTMTAFSFDCARIIRFFGTEGDLVLDESRDSLTLKQFGGGREEYSVSGLNKSSFGHGGGEIGLIDALYRLVSGEEESATTLMASVESHLMAICAEESRLKGGALVKIH